jgi:hypothetical protein
VLSEDDQVTVSIQDVSGGKGDLQFVLAAAGRLRSAGRRLPVDRLRQRLGAPVITEMYSRAAPAVET